MRTIPRKLIPSGKREYTEDILVKAQRNLPLFQGLIATSPLQSVENTHMVVTEDVI